MIRFPASRVAVGIAAAALAVLAAGAAVAAHGGGKASRRTNPRTGRLAPAMVELVKAAKRGDGRARRERDERRAGQADGDARCRESDHYLRVTTPLA